MKRILILADTHGDISESRKLLNNIIGINMVIHLGDYLRDAVILSKEYPEIEFEYVPGNNDFRINQDEKLLIIDDVKIYICHGHTKSVSSGLEYVARSAKSKGAEFAFFGHVHYPIDEIYDGVRCFCPGSPSRPRSGNASVGIMEIDKGYIGLSHYPLGGSFL
ncbi:MAG: YfcE family phosphodiesterase [Bacillota bacterium]|nr:YfcE family phosphodiesterase [Bacillota bacterium]